MKTTFLDERAEAASAGEPVLRYAPDSRGAADYKALVSEFLHETARPQGASAEKVRRGIQKRLATIFDGVWMPKNGRPGSGPVDST